MCLCSCRDGDISQTQLSISCRVNLAITIVMRSHPLHDTVTNYDIDISDHPRPAALSTLIPSQHSGRDFVLKAATSGSTTNRNEQYSNNNRQNRHQQEACWPKKYQIPWSATRSFYRRRARQHILTKQ
jgi:hypothetical protein